MRSTWKVLPIFTDVVFVVAATLCLALLGWAVQINAPSWVASGTTFMGTLTTSPWTRAAFSVYLVAAASVGVILPLAALFMWGRYSSVRAALLPYALVLLVQIAVEELFARIFFPGLVVVIGFGFTLYRVQRLWGARRVFARAAQPPGLAKPFVEVVLSSSLVFWSFNTVFLVAVTVLWLARA